MCANKIKKGDYVICIKSYNQLFDLNKKYKVRDIYDDGYILLISYYKMCSGFELLETKSNRYFFDYFITLQQYRKLKLEKIYEKR
jgi:hypothetical protein